MNDQDYLIWGFQRGFGHLSTWLPTKQTEHFLGQAWPMLGDQFAQCSLNHAAKTCLEWFKMFISAAITILL